MVSLRQPASLVAGDSLNGLRRVSAPVLHAGVWPGSHARLWGACTEEQKGNGNKSPEHLATLDAIREDTVAVDLHGPAGTLVLWHPRLGHMAGPNMRDRIRMGLLYDYHAKTGHGQHPADMWQDWGHEVKFVAHTLRSKYEERCSKL